MRSDKPYWTAIPNFVDTDVFRPSRDETEKRELRRLSGIPEEAFVIGCVAAVKKHHKRIDYLIREFSVFAGGSGPQFLLIAGAKTNETEELQSLAAKLCPDNIKILTDVSREGMPDLYRCFDLFVLTSLFEMMPIAVLEALASGLPLITNAHPVLEWMVGSRKSEVRGRRSEGGSLPCTVSSPRDSGAGPGNTECGGAGIDMSRQGALSEFLGVLDPVWIDEHGKGARRRAEQMFSKDVVIKEYITYYEKIMGRDILQKAAKDAKGEPGRELQ